MKKETTHDLNRNDDTNVVATATLQEALGALKVPQEAVMILAGFRALVPTRVIV